MQRWRGPGGSKAKASSHPSFVCLSAMHSPAFHPDICFPIYVPRRPPRSSQSARRDGSANGHTRVWTDSSLFQRTQITDRSHTTCVLMQVRADEDVQSKGMILMVGSRERIVQQEAWITRVRWDRARSRGLPGQARMWWLGTAGATQAEQHGLELLDQEASFEKVGGHQVRRGFGGCGEELGLCCR